MTNGLRSAEERAALQKKRAQQACEAGYAHTLSMNVQYDGAPFAGFARQVNCSKATVQGELEQALSLLYKRDIPTICAGRTDAGVHALGQVVSFDLTEDEFSQRSLHTLARAMNALVDNAISIKAIQEQPLGFSARFDAQWREYRYYICTQSARPVLIAPFVWHLGGVELDISAMTEAATYLIGEHDFKSFCVTSSSIDKPTHRNVGKLEVCSEEIMGTPMFTMRVVGNAFLHSMVRTIVGTLVEVGRGKRPATWVQDVLEARNRTAAGQTAPANGLVFWHVEY